jgi:aminoglycoside phosphotransferase (APT) family kinase protein
MTAVPATDTQTFSARLADYFSARIPGARDLRVEGLSLFPAGASKQTWSVDVRWRDDAGEQVRGFVVRCSPEGAGPLDTGAGVEFHTYRALEGSTIPVPRALWLEEDGAALGMPFYVMERIDGCASDMPGLAVPANAHLRPVIGHDLARILAGVHRLDIAALAFLGPAPAPEDCATKEVDFWHAVLRQEAIEPRPGLEAVFRWLRRHLPPPPPRVTVVHGDFRNGNYLYNDTGVVAMLDWEMVHLGDPMEDVGWLLMMSWRRFTAGLVGGLAPWEQFCRWYEEMGGERVDERAVRFWDVFAHVKLATILATGGWRFSKGQSTDIMQGQLGITAWGTEQQALEMIRDA